MKNGLMPATNVHRAAIACVLFLFVNWASSSRGQADVATPWDSRFEDPLTSQITPKFVEKFESFLQLSPEQRVAVSHTLMAHQERFDQLVAEGQKLRKAFNKRLDAVPPVSPAERSILVEREEKLAPIADRQNKLDEQFLEEVRPMLSEEQAARWPAFIQRFNRERWLRHTGGYLEEQADLIAILEASVKEAPIDILSREDIRQVLDDYSVQIDKPLRTTVERSVAASRRYDRFQAERTDDDVEKALVKREDKRDRQLQKDLRDLTRSFQSTIAALLPESMQPIFHQAYQEVIFRDYIRLDRLPGDKMLKSVALLKDVSSEQQKVIDGLSESRKPAMEQACQVLLQAHTKMIDGWEIYALNDPETEKLRLEVNQAAERCFGVERQFIDALWMELTPEQQARVIKPKVVPDHAP